MTTQPKIRTMQQLEVDMDSHRANKLHFLTLAAIEAGNASDARDFATSLIHHYHESQNTQMRARIAAAHERLMQMREDARVFGDDVPLLVDIRDERQELRRAA